jgi:transposase-like protein
MAKQYDLSFRQDVLESIKNGARVSEVCSQRGLSVKTVYAWLRKQADNTGTSSLELARLRKENQELKEIIGMFALEKKRAEKNTKGA